jgi:hypothetical protein
MARENVIVVSFADDRSAYEAFTNLKELDEQGAPTEPQPRAVLEVMRSIGEC